MTSPLHRHLAFLFAFDLWANRAVADALSGALDPTASRTGGDRVGEAARLFAHLTRASEVWLGRVQRTDAAGLPVWPEEVGVPSSAARAARTELAWRVFLASTSTEGLGRGVQYANSRGERFETALSEIAAHVVNHGSHHRGQIARLLRETGLPPPALDLIAYARGPEREPERVAS